MKKNKLQQFDEDKLVLVEDPAGDVLKENDIKRFIKGIENVKVGTKTTNTTLTCLTGFVLQWAKYGLKK